MNNSHHSQAATEALHGAAATSTEHSMHGLGLIEHLRTTIQSSGVEWGVAELLSAEFIGVLALVAFGLIGSASHCGFMCGPLVFLGDQRPSLPVLWRRSIFQSGRFLGYFSLLLFLLGIGEGVAAVLGPGGRGLFRVVLAIVVVLNVLVLVWPQLGLKRISQSVLVQPHQAALHARSKVLQSQGSYFVDSLFTLGTGFAWGLMPCGLSWVAIIAAAQLGSVSWAFAGLFGFWLATVPLQVVLYRVGIKGFRHLPRVVLMPFAILYLWMAIRTIIA